MTRHWTRRSMVKAMGGLTAAAAFGSLGGQAGLAQDKPTPVPTSAPVNLGGGDIKISVWVQDYGPSIAVYKDAAQRYVKSNNNVSVTVQPIAFQDLQTKLVPSIAAGKEADIMMGYTNWYIATDISKLFLRLDEAMGGLAAVQSMFVPEVLSALDIPEGSVYYLPTGAGLNGNAITVDKKLYDSKGIDYHNFKSWEDVMAAAKEVTEVKDGKIARAGLALATSTNVMIWALEAWIWQLGGEFYNHDNGKWSFSSPEGEAALQHAFDVYNGPSAVGSFDLITNDTNDMAGGRLATHLDGAYSVANTEQLFPKFVADGLPTPPLAGAKTNVIHPAHMSVVTLSRRLTKNDKKRDHCIGIVKEMFNVDAQLSRLNTYSGSILDKRVYADPRITNYRYGAYSKMVTDATFSRARYAKDHVANTDPAETEFIRALRKEISIKEALKNADDYLNDQEQQARERIGK